MKKDESDDKEKLLRISEAARRLMISRETLYRWAEQGKIPFVSVGKEKRFRVEDIEHKSKEKYNRGQLRIETKEQLDYYLYNTDYDIKPGNVDIPGKRYCGNCQTLKPATIEHFYARPKYQSGFDFVCIPCCSIKRKENYVKKHQETKT